MRPLLVIGTRPEAIKMAPVVRECRQRPDRFEPVVCFTGQHRQMLQQVADVFQIEPDVSLDLMRPDQTLAGLTARCLELLDEVICRRQPECVVAQGDTTTVLAASMAAFYRRVPFVHVEAGLRTGCLHAPWPEEFNRRAAGLTAGIHCAPTRRAAENLLAEHVPPASVHVTGNTVIDALLWIRDQQRDKHSEACRNAGIMADGRLVLITGHRRENFGGGMLEICLAIAELATRFPDIAFVYPVHLNPNVRQPVHQHLGNLPNVRLLEPLSYPDFVWLMDRATLILTDSGGVQEEAPALGKPVLVMRDTTERPEAVEAGAAELVGACRRRIVERTVELLTDPAEYARRQPRTNPYGDGHAARRIVDLIERRAWLTEIPAREAA